MDMNSPYEQHHWLRSSEKEFLTERQTAKIWWWSSIQQGWSEALEYVTIVNPSLENFIKIYIIH